MSPAESPRLRTRDTQEALQAVERLLHKHRVIDENQAYRAVQALVPEEEVSSPIDFDRLLGREKPEEAAPEGDEASEGAASSDEEASGE